jgi:hypothetical protein
MSRRSHASRDEPPPPAGAHQGAGRLSFQRRTESWLPFHAWKLREALRRELREAGVTGVIAIRIAADGSCSGASRACLVSNRITHPSTTRPEARAAPESDAKKGP